VSDLSNQDQSQFEDFQRCQRRRHLPVLNDSVRQMKAYGVVVIENVLVLFAIRGADDIENAGLASSVQAVTG
jgi:hypothetical protein